MEINNRHPYFSVLKVIRPEAEEILNSPLVVTCRVGVEHGDRPGHFLYSAFAVKPMIGCTFREFLALAFAVFPFRSPSFCSTS